MNILLKTGKWWFPLSENNKPLAGCHGSRGKLNLAWEYNHQIGTASMVRSLNQIRGVFLLEKRKSKERDDSHIQFERSPSD